MELLQKLTLYDLFGYTLPGVLAIWLYKYGGMLEQIFDISLSSLGILIVLGYVAGVILTEISECLEKLLRKFTAQSRIDKYWQDLCKIYGISADMVKHALDKAKITDYNLSAGVDTLVREYRTYMHSEIQTDAQYGRLHNYLSAELLYKNMFLVSLYAVYIGYKNQQTVSAQIGKAQMVIGAIGAICFAARRVRFAERSRGYTICWFVQKYGKDN